MTHYTQNNFRRQPLGFTLIELLVVMGILALLVSLLMPSVGKALARGRATHCLNNLRQLGLAVQSYAQDYGGILPVAEPMPSEPLDPANPLPRIRDLLARYVGDSAEVFKCPNDTTRFAVEGSSYMWHFPSSGRNLNTVKTPLSNIILMYDYDAVHLDKGGSGTKNFVFADGHVASP